MTIKRINRGKGHSYSIDGKRADGVTTLIGDGMPKPALVGWAANVTAAYAVDHWTELEHKRPSERLDELKGARYAELDKAGRRGTEVHTLAENLAHGRQVDVPEELAGHVESAVRFLDDWRVDVVLTETVVASRQWGYAGTLDLVHHCACPIGGNSVSDWKTSRSGIFGEAALQCGAYAHADVYLDGDGDEQPVADLGITHGHGIWIRADGYDVYPLDLERGFKIFTHVMYVARQKDIVRYQLVGDALTAPAGQGSAA